MKNLFSLVALFILMEMQAQPPPFPKSLDKYKVIDTVSYLVTYQLNFINDTKTNKKGDDIVILEIGKNYAKSFSKKYFDADSISTAWLKKGAKGLPHAKGNMPVMDVYKDYKNKKNTVVFRSILSGPVYKYEEPTNLMAWTIHPEKKTIVSYLCQKATTTFRGREYEVWFTKDIPLPEGPWKFGGLPGLILYVKERQDNFIFECIGIEKIKIATSMKYWLWSYEDIKREQLQKVMKRMYLNTYDYCISIGQDVAGDPMENKKKLVYPHNPIELE